MRTLLACLLISGCGAQSRRLDDGDADSDVDADADADSDGDTDTDTDTTGSGTSFRPEEICGLPDLFAAGPASIRVLGATRGCEDLRCTVVDGGGTIDLRPTTQPISGDIDCSPGPAWVDCPVAAPRDGPTLVTVWGEPIGSYCSCDVCDCEADGQEVPDCFQLPLEPLPDDCQLTRPIVAYRGCFPVTAPANGDARVVATDGCMCGDVEAGCEVRFTEGGLTFTPRSTQCGHCDACYDLDVTCHLYDIGPGTMDVAIAPGALSGEVAFDWGATGEPLVCQEMTSGG